MSCVLPKAIFTLSIDLELDPMRPARDQQRSLEAVTGQLVRLLGRYQFPATWAVADPAMSAATEPLVHAEAGHEVAILGDPTWVGADAGRMRFGRELARRVMHGRAAGLQISTLALRHAELADHLDLLIKHDISVVRGNYHEVTSRWFRRPILHTPAALRFGLWDVPASMQLPSANLWKLGGGGRRRGRKGIDMAIASGGVFHLQVDALSLAERGTMAEHVLHRILHHAAECRKQDAIEIVTLATVARRLTGDRSNTPARSILHPAA